VLCSDIWLDSGSVSGLGLEYKGLGFRFIFSGLRLRLGAIGLWCEKLILQSRITSYNETVCLTRYAATYEISRTLLVLFRCDSTRHLLQAPYHCHTRFFTQGATTEDAAVITLLQDLRPVSPNFNFKVDLTGRFDDNLANCVSPTFNWPSTWHKFNRPSMLS